MISKTQLAAELGVGEQTVAIYRAKYEMPEPIRLGGKLYWRRDDIENWLRTFLPTRAKGKS